MSYLWALDFPIDICGTGDEIRDFVIAYINGWLGFMDDGGDFWKTSFEHREKFIKMWRESDLDL